MIINKRQYRPDNRKQGKKLIRAVGNLVMIGAASLLICAPSSSKTLDTKAVESLLRDGDTTSALQSIEHTMQVDKSDYTALYWLGLIQYARAEYSQAKESFQGALDIRSKHYQSLYRLALTQIHLGEFSEAEASIRKGSKKARTLRIEFRGAEDSLAVGKQEFARNGGVSVGIGAQDKTTSGDSSAGSNKSASEEELKRNIRQEPKEPLTHFALGKFYFDQEMFSEAESCFRDALKANKNHELSNYYLGLTMIEDREFVEAEKLFEKRLARGKSLLPEFNNGLGLIHLAQARILHDSAAGRDAIFEEASKADERFRAAIALNAENPRYHLNLAEANFLRGIFPPAKAEYEKALAISDGSPEILINYAQACYKMKDYTCAMEQAGKVIALDSTNAQAWKMAGSIYFGSAVASRSSEEAVNHYKNSIAAYRKYRSLVSAEADSSNVQVFYHLATALQRLGGHTEAIENFKAVLAIPVIPRDIYLSLGKSYSSLKDWNSAIANFDSHKQWVSEQGASYKSSITEMEMNRRLGNAYYGLKEYMSAITYLVRAFDADTTQTKLLVSISLSYHNLKDYADAFPYYQRLLSQELGEQMWSLYLNGAYCALALAGGGGDDDDDMEEEMEEESISESDPLENMAASDFQLVAVDWLLKTLEYKPNHAKATTLLATTYLYDLSDCVNGVAWYQKVHKQSPDDCESLRSLGYAYFGGVCTKNFAKAISYLGQALDCYGGDPCSSTEISLWIAQAYHLQAVAKVEKKEKAASKVDFKKAHEWYGKVLECDPGNTDAKEGQGQVQFEF